MAAEKRTEYGPLVPNSLYDADVDRFTSYTELPGGSHDGASVPGSPSQLQPEASRTAEHEPFPPLEPSVPAEDLLTRDRTAAFNSARAPLPRRSHGVTRSTATAVEEPPAVNLDAVEIRAAKDNHDPRRGVCARLDMAADRQIIHETPLFSCDKPRRLWGTHQSIALAWTTLNGQTRNELQAEFAGMLGLSTRAGLSKTQRQQLEGFVKEYASADTGGRRVHIHRIASHINHACGRCANAKATIDSADPNSISVTLLRSVSTGEQILIKYKKPNAPCFNNPKRLSNIPHKNSSNPQLTSNNLLNTGMPHKAKARMLHKVKARTPHKAKARMPHKSNNNPGRGASASER
ncbi:hypothetical protein Neosp_006682 [[Neocosmospora] mangrovei]